MQFIRGRRKGKFANTVYIIKYEIISHCLLKSVGLFYEKKPVDFALTLYTIYSNWYKHFENMYDNRSLRPHYTVTAPPLQQTHTHPEKLWEGLYND